MRSTILIQAGAALFCVSTAVSQTTPPAQPPPAESTSSASSAPVLAEPPAPVELPSPLADRNPVLELPDVRTLDPATVERAEKARERRDEAIRLTDFRNDTLKVLELARRISVLPMHADGPNPVALRSLQQLCKETEKSIGRLDFTARSTDKERQRQLGGA